MYVRLAFAVAAHLEPEILIVDEVLAVGDASFRRNASAKMSHNPLEIRIWVRHAKPIARACFSFHVINQFQQAVIHAFAYHPDIRFGDVPGCSMLTCRIPELQLNVGQYYLRCFLSGPPDTVMYDIVDGICSFEVLRTDRVVPWGWRADACVYHEKYTWNVADESPAREGGYGP
jgi:hypothetical protein